VYVCVALVWGIIQLSVLPPYQVPDEAAHYNRAWGIAQGQVDCGPTSLVNVPQNVLTFFNSMEVHIGFPGSYTFSDAAVFADQTFSSEHVNLYTPACAYNPLSYVPAAAAIDVVRVLNLSPFHAFYAARLLTLLVAVALTTWAIRRMPFGKWLLVVVALLPMTVQQFASASADAITLSGLFLFAALALDYAQRAKLSGRSQLALLVASVVLVQLKPIYLPLLALVLLVQPKQFASWKRYVLFLLLVAAVNGLLAFGLYQLFAGAVPLAPTTTIDPGAQLEVLRSQPATVVRILHNDFLERATVYTFGMLGVPGWLHFAYPNGFYFFILAGFLFVSSSLERTIPLRVWQRVLLLGAAYAGVMAFGLFMFVYWTVPGAVTLDGIQGRYFLPMLPLVLLAVSGIRIPTAARRALVVVALVTFTGVIAIGGVRNFYYLDGYLSTVPEHSQVLTDDFSRTELINAKRLDDGQFAAANDDPQLIIDVSGSAGFSLQVVATGPMELRYRFAGSEDWDSRFDLIKLPGQRENYGYEPRTIDFSVAALEEIDGRELESVRVDLTDHRESFRVRRFDTYLP